MRRAAALVRAPRAAARATAIRVRSRSWPDHSRLFVLGDELGWVLDDEAAYVSSVARAAGYGLGPAAWARSARRQVVFHTSHFAALDPVWTRSSHRLGASYFHGRPGTPGYPEFDRAYDALRREPERLARIHVTHGEMEELVRSAGVDPERIHRIPLGVDLPRFPLADEERRAAARASLDLPGDAFVVGSFQKDGVGLEEGLEPKLVKGPDVLVEALALVHERVEGLVVLLTGLARGYVRRGLEERGIPHVHRLLPDRDGLARAYQALDAYVVASRQEGGPKGVLESLASGIPLVTTRVGQAVDLVRDGENGLLVEVDDVEGISAGLVRIAREPALVSSFRLAGRATAEATSDAALVPRWRTLLDDFAERGDG
jgi:glycosyltransferase involved in cell wall biosynthesis